jgi:O-antigen ligase
LTRLAARVHHSHAAEWLLTVATIGVVSVVAASSIAGMSTRPSKVLVAVIALACASILLTISADQLLLGWLFAAPLLQESATKTHLGHALSLALYVAPPVALLLKLVTSRGPRPRREWFDVLPAAYVALLLVSLAITATKDLKPSTLHLLYQNVALGVLVYYVVAFWRGRLPSALRIAQVLLLAAALQALMAVVEWPTGWNLWHDTGWQGADARSIGTLANPAVTGAFIGVGIVVALAVLCWHAPPALHRLALVMLVVGVPGLYATKTRGPILATAIVATLCVLLSARSRLVALATIAFVALTLGLFWPQIKTSSTYRNRFNESQNVEARLVLQDVSIRLAEKKPFLGWGYGSFDRVKYDVPVHSSGIATAQALQSTSHDTFLTILVEFGAVGLTLFVLPWLPILKRSLAHVRARAPDRWFLVAATASFLVVAFDAATLDFRFFSFAPILLWLFLGLVRRQTGFALGERHA